MRARVLGLVVLAPLLGPSAAVADTAPSVWDRVRDPAQGDRWRLHVTVERLLHPPRSEDRAPLEDDRADELSLEQARVALEEADAAHSPDVRLSFDLGIVYERLGNLERDNGLYELAVAVLGPALAASPSHPGAVGALSALAFSLAKLDRPRDELATWRRYLPKLTDESERLTPMMNMGEAEMRVGQLDEALATFRSAVDLCQALPNSAALSEEYALLLWDIGITLDRQGDPSGALRIVATARSFSWTVNIPGADPPFRTLTGWDAIQDDDDVFFVPNWEREWYLALGEAALASDSTDARVAAVAWAQAERHWGTYFTAAASARAEAAASPGGRETPVDRWAALARLRRDHARRARIESEKRASASPPARASAALPARASAAKSQ
jgi:tetratricopeptide (TPR) repeat protein